MTQEEKQKKALDDLVKAIMSRPEKERNDFINRLNKLGDKIKTKK